ncbi:hypothetical protein B0H13DRAFT_1897721 [Mycena leptocephala]|nr:hypothetical protein B0H13DRAFT_1897721 [Mycena leptocephala]
MTKSLSRGCWMLPQATGDPADYLHWRDRHGGGRRERANMTRDKIIGSDELSLNAIKVTRFLENKRSNEVTKKATTPSFAMRQKWPSSPSSVSSQSTVYHINEITMDETTLDLIIAYERIHEPQNDLRALDSQVARIAELEHDLQEAYLQVDRLQGIVNGYEISQADLRQRLRTLERGNTESNAAQVASPPSTPSRLRTGTTGATRSVTPRTPCIRSTPPPYVSVSTPTRLQAPTEARMDLGAATHQFLADHGLEVHTDAIRLICRLFSPVKWSAEVAALECFPVDAKPAFLIALEEDTPF